MTALDSLRWIVQKQQENQSMVTPSFTDLAILELADQQAEVLRRLEVLEGRLSTYPVD